LSVSESEMKFSPKLWKTLWINRPPKIDLA
jgi:hypothetical protein